MRIGQTSAVYFLSEVLSSVLGFAATLYVAKALGQQGDDVLGVYFVVIALVIWLSVVGGLGLQVALRKRLSESDEGPAYLAAGLLIQTAVFVVVAAVLLLAAPYLTGFLRGVDVGVVVGLVFAALALQFVRTALEGRHLVHVSSVLSPLDRIARAVVQIGAVFLGFALGGLLLGYAVGAVVAAAAGAVVLGRDLAFPERRHVTDLVSYARYSWLSSVSARAFRSLDTVVLGLFVAEGLIGVYEIAWNLASILAVFGTAIARSMFPSISELSAQEEVAAVAGLVTDSLRFAGFFLIPGFVGAILLGGEVLRIYGSQFTRGNVVLVVLVGARLVYTYQHQFVNALNAIDRPDLAFRVEGVFVVTNLGLNVALVLEFGWIGAAVATALSALLATLLAHRALAAEVDFELPLAELGRQVFASLVMGGVVLAGTTALPGTLPVGLGLVFLGAAVYGVVVFVISPTLRQVVVVNLSSVLDRR